MEKATTTFRTGSTAEFLKYDAATLCSVRAAAGKQPLLCGQYCSWYTFQAGCKMERSSLFRTRTIGQCGAGYALFIYILEIFFMKLRLPC